MIYKQEIQRIKAEIRREPFDGSGGEFTRDLTYASNCTRPRLFPCLDSNHVINALITELPNYVGAAHNVIMACKEDEVKW